MNDIASLALKTREAAAGVVVRHKKDASFRLYAVLAPCMELCERCERDPAERVRLDALFSAQPADGNRRYVERGSDIYVLVCRFVFSGTNRTNAIRYSQALREAAKRQIGSNTLERWLRENGGVNALYFSRPLPDRLLQVKTLRLDRPVSFSRKEPFSITLHWTPQNTFRLLDRPLPPPPSKGDT